MTVCEWCGEHAADSERCDDCENHHGRVTCIVCCYAILAAAAS